jgi:hypothetical protein
LSLVATKKSKAILENGAEKWDARARIEDEDVRKE